MNFYTGSGMPSSPIGNVAMAQGPLPYVSVGGAPTQQPQYPYQGGYYGYYNPWEIQKQQDQYFQQQAAYKNGIVDFEKAIIAGAHETCGVKISDSELEEYFAQFRPQYSNSAEYFKQQTEMRKEQALQQAIQRVLFQPQVTRLDRYVQYFNEQEEEMAKRYEGKTLEEQYETLNEIAFDQEMEKARRANRDLRTGYNGSDYRNLITQSANNFRNVFGNTNIDDYEVALPSSIEASYADKRARFLQKILGPGL